FDLLALDDADLRTTPFGERRATLEKALAEVRPPVHLTPATADAGVAAEWFDRFEGAGLDGVVAKPVSLPYKEDQRVMLKVKHARTADCVVAGYRVHKDGGGVGSLLLGLYDDEGTLHHVGVASSFSVVRRRELADEIAPYEDHALDGHPWAAWAEAEAQAAAAGGPNAGHSRMPGGQSRWNAGRNMAWEPLRPELVAEVAFDHLQGDRFRHATQFVRWRPEREARSCTYSQLDVAVPEELEAVFRA
ncbi:MAG: ATP-dependent DNA ligase, partial [Actinomycetota bacterium]|nr:ATP-dependent DNA ligase [Actinomycetota bacterium]